MIEEEVAQRRNRLVVAARLGRTSGRAPDPSSDRPACRRRRLSRCRMPSVASVTARARSVAASANSACSRPSDSVGRAIRVDQSRARLAPPASASSTSALAREEGRQIGMNVGGLRPQDSAAFRYAAIAPSVSSRRIEHVALKKQEIRLAERVDRRCGRGRAPVATRRSR